MMMLQYCHSLENEHSFETLLLLDANKLCAREKRGTRRNKYFSDGGNKETKECENSKSTVAFLFI